MQDAIAAGADSLVHSIYTEIVDDATWKRMSAGRIAWIPSLGVMMANCEPKSYAEMLVSEPSFLPAMPEKRQLEMRDLECRRIAARNIRRARSLGVTVATEDTGLGLGRPALGLPPRHAPPGP